MSPVLIRILRLMIPKQHACSTAWIGAAIVIESPLYHACGTESIALLYLCRPVDVPGVI